MRCMSLHACRPLGRSTIPKSTICTAAPQLHPIRMIVPGGLAAWRLHVDHCSYCAAPPEYFEHEPVRHPRSFCRSESVRPPSGLAEPVRSCRRPCPPLTGLSSHWQCTQYRWTPAHGTLGVHVTLRCPLGTGQCTTCEPAVFDSEVRYVPPRPRAVVQSGWDSDFGDAVILQTANV